MVNSVLIFCVILGVAQAQLTQQGVAQFLNTEGINPNQLVTSNCVTNGNPCTTGGQPCCLNPVFLCQPSPGSQGGQGGSNNVCLVNPLHDVHIPIIRQILAAYGVTTQNPIQK